MTEVANLIPPDHRLTTVRHYEAALPQEVGPEDTFATTKEEEWVSKKKTEVINTKQIETRVKRQVVLEDGKVVEDSGPQVTTNTKEDTETKEHHQTELRKPGDDANGGDSPTSNIPRVGGGGDTPDSKWVAVPNPDGIVREVKERKIVSREETEHVKETEDVQHLGDITDEDFLSAIKSGHSDLRKILRTKQAGGVLVSTGPRLIRDTSKSNKVTDTEETRELSSVRADGRIVTETQRTTEHEEVDDREQPPDAAADVNTYKESSQRFFKAREQEDVDYYADGVKIAHEMRFKGETTECERRGDGMDDTEWDSLSARARRRAANQPRFNHRHRVDLISSPLDRKDALTRRPLDFDQEEETRKVETSKWLENHFGSESRSSKDSLGDEDEHHRERQQPPKTNFFNVTIKSTTTPSPSKYPPPQQQQQLQQQHQHQHQQSTQQSNGYFKGISEWSERRQDYSAGGVHQQRQRVSDEAYRYRPQSPDYRGGTSPVREQPRTPTPPQRKRITERRQRASQESRYDSGYRTPSRTEGRDEPLEEPPPDYSPPTPPPMMMHHEKKAHQKTTRFAADTTSKESIKDAVSSKQKSGNIIGQSIRKLVGKIRSASAERKARQRAAAKRSPSPSYQAGHQIDLPPPAMNTTSSPSSMMDKPVQRYYLGEDPFAGSIYGRENKYDGVKPARSSRARPTTNGSRNEYHEERSQSTLGRFTTTTTANNKPLSSSATRFSQTLPRHATGSSSNSNKHEAPTRLDNNNSSNTINVSIINTVNTPSPPTKPLRSYLARSKSFNVNALNNQSLNSMYKSNPHLNRMNDSLKSPGLISSLSRSQHDFVDNTYNTTTTSTSRFARNGASDEVVRSPPSTSLRYDMYEPPTRLRSTNSSSAAADYNETYHTTSRNDDPLRPSVTNTTQNFSKKTVPLAGGRGVETIESSETHSVTKSHYRGMEPIATRGTTASYYDETTKSGHHQQRFGSVSPVVIEVRHYNRK